MNKKRNGTDARTNSRNSNKNH
nr:hypothetical protein [Riemerella anatipestifer]